MNLGFLSLYRYRSTISYQNVSLKISVLQGQMQFPILVLEIVRKKKISHWRSLLQKLHSTDTSLNADYLRKALEQVDWPIFAYLKRSFD